MSLHLILNNIRSVYNVGSLFRTADAAGVEHIHLIGVTPQPIDRFGRPRKDFHKTALGAETSVAWSSHETLAGCIQTLKNQNVTIVAVEQDETSIPYTEIPLETPVALVLGEETEGIPREELALCDLVAEIPQHGAKESLNVSVAGGVVLFDLSRRLN